MARQLAAPYILPIHYDLPRTEANPAEISQQIQSIVLNGDKWHVFKEKKEVEEY
jgi:L-ascorbate metabolism protein UlaG (beta-lactamase superfamily)